MSRYPYDCSLVIVNWNTKTLLERCLVSIATGAQKISYEIFVVDNGSADGSVAMVQTLFPVVKLIANEYNRGFGYANNQALRQAQGRYFLLLNSDAYLPPHSLDQMIAFMDEHPQIGLTGPQLRYPDDKLQNSIANTPNLLTELGQKSLLRLLAPKYYQNPVGNCQAVETIVGAALLVRQAMTLEVGLFDEDFFFYFEETDWCVRAHKAGWQIFFLGEISVYHARGLSTKTHPAAARIEFWRSRYTFFKKHYSGWTCGVLRMGLLLRLLVALPANYLLGFFNKKSHERSTTLLKILIWHLRGCPKTTGLPGLRKSGLMIQ